MKHLVGEWPIKCLVYTYGAEEGNIVVAIGSVFSETILLEATFRIFLFIDGALSAFVGPCRRTELYE